VGIAVVGAALGSVGALAEELPFRRLDEATGAALNAAIGALSAQRYDDALAAIGGLDYESLTPYARARVWQIRFNVSFAAGQYETARAQLQSAIDAGGLTPPEVARAQYQRAQTFLQEERWQDGVSELETWLVTHPEPNPAADYLVAVAYFQLGDFDRALPHARRAVELAPEVQENWLYLLASLRLKRAEFEEAERLLQRLVALAPEKKTYLQQLSSVYGATGKYGDALATMQLAYDSGFLTEDRELRRFADFLFFREQPRRCVEVLERAIDDERVTADEALEERLADCRLAAREHEPTPGHARL
jgi:tetratricopeptide (TPR) repeat protein